MTQWVDCGIVTTPEQEAVMPAGWAILVVASLADAGRAAHRLFAATLLVVVLLALPAHEAGAAPVRHEPGSAGAVAGASRARQALEQAILGAPDAVTNDHFGCSVAIDGDTALVGASSHSGDGAAGAAYIFVRSGGTWTLQQELTVASGLEAGSGFGYAVALSGDVAIVGAPGPNGQSGSAYVFMHAGGTWTGTQKLNAPDGTADDAYGSSVAVSGAVAVVGAKWQTVAGKWSAGAAYVYDAFGSWPERVAWILQTELTAADGAASDHFGISVGIDAGTIVVGADQHDPGATPYAGAAYVYTLTGGAWPLQAELSAADPATGAAFGRAVAVSGDSALIGSPMAPNTGSQPDGAAYVFTRSEIAWSQQAKLVPIAGYASTHREDFGAAVALDGGTAVVGAPGHDVSSPASVIGEAFVFTRTGLLWTSQPRLTPSDGALRDRYGAAVAVGGDTVLVGAPVHLLGGVPRAGAAYAFLLTPSVTSFSPQSGPVGTQVTIVGGYFTGVTGVAFNGVPAPGIIAFGTQITATVPVGASTGPITVTTATGTGSSTVDFTVVKAKPQVTAVTPAKGKHGALVTITGKWFGKKRGSSYVRFGATKVKTYLSWSATKIKCRVPIQVAHGPVRLTVTTAVGTSRQPVVFTVVP